MGKKRVADPGLKFLNKIEFERLTGVYGFADRLEREFGDTKARMIWDEMHQYEPGSIEFYEFKNSIYELSNIISYAWDSDIIRKSVNFIDKNKSAFGKEILEVGCDSGFITLALAMMFPDSHITSIDRNASAIKIAQQRLDKYDIKNVTLVVSDIMDMQGEYDTVVSIRTLHEMIDGKKAMSPYKAFKQQFEDYIEFNSFYAEKLCSLIKESGYLMTFERNSQVIPFMIGWIGALNNYGCGIDLNSYQMIKCEEENRQTSVFQAFICKKDYKLNNQEIYDFWVGKYQINVNGKNRLENYDALIYLDRNAGEFINGFEVYNDKNYLVGRFIAYYDCDDKNLIYYLRSGSDGMTSLEAINCNEQDNLKSVLGDMERIREINTEPGLHIQDILEAQE